MALGCASAPPRPRVDGAALAREADAEIDRGCYLCLKSAAEKYEQAIAAGVRSLELPAAGAWTLLAVRERELGIRPSDALERARMHALPRTAAPGLAGRKQPPRAPAQDSAEVIDAYVRIASSLPPLREGASMETLAAAGRAQLAEGLRLGAVRELAGEDGRQARLVAPTDHPDPPTVALMRRRAVGDADRTASYLIRSLECSFLASPSPGAPGTAGLATAAQGSPPSGLGAFLTATCRAQDTQRSESILTRQIEVEPRFHEAHFFLGRLALGNKKLVSAEREFLAAADGIPAMAAAWAMLGSTRILEEEYEWAAADIARALDIEPDQRQTLLAYARALNYAGRFEEAIAPAQRLLDLGAWYVSDANYWLAFSELQLGRLQAADAHAREAKRTNPMDGDTARLVGLVAHRLAEFDRAQEEFELAVSRNQADCESHLHLGMIHGKKDRFDVSIVSFLRARDCYAALAESSASKRAEIDASSLSEARKEVARGRLVRKIQGYRSAQASASLGSAEGEIQRGDYEKALERLAEAEDAGGAALNARANEMRTRISALVAASRRKR
jgi:tetratricopeptide (TPR) repeat protein